MSEPSAALPIRPSLEQLRKQARERLDSMPGAKLADAQFALARHYGFESWPKLVRHVEALAYPGVEQQERMARDMVAAYCERDEAAAGRLNDLFHSSITIDQIQQFIQSRLNPLPGGSDRLAGFGMSDARLLVARLYGFDDWDELVTAAAGTPLAGAPGISATPPFYTVDEERGTIAPQQPMSAHDWNVLVRVMRERGLTGLQANSMMDDGAMGMLAATVPDVRVLDLHGSNRLTDEGLRHLATFRALEEVAVGGWHSPMTDRGLASIAGLPQLRTVRSHWSRRLTDGGIEGTLASCPAIENADFMGTAGGDGLIRALADKPGVWRIFCGDGVTDAGLRQLHGLPRFTRWMGGERRYSLLEFDAGPTYLAIKGPFTAAGLGSLAGLDGLFALNVHWTSGATRTADLALLSGMANLGFLTLDGDLCDDEAMRQIGRLPGLRMLLAQEPVAGDAGFEGLSKSATIEHLWGRECPGLTGRGFAAMMSMPALKGLAVSLKHVDDQALARLPRFPSLRALMPMDVGDEGFRHVGRCARLEELWCMYCADTGDAATGHVAGLQLRTYYAGATQITDRSLEVLSRMASLERIELQYCQGITDAGVRALAKLPAVRQVAIEGCRNVTRRGAAAFAPPVRVRYSTR